MLNVAFSIDDTYVTGAAVTAHSIRAGTGPGADIRFHVVDAGLSAAGRDRLAGTLGRLGELEVHRVPDMLALPEKKKWFTSATLGRIHLDVLPPDVERVVYLDADTLVLGDLTELYRTDTGDGGLAAVINEVGPARTLVPSDDGAELVRHHDGAAAPGYFNAGVLLVDLERWREEDVTGQGVRLFTRYGPSLRDLDQDVLNVLFASRWRSLPMIWNRMVEHRHFGKFGHGRLDHLTRREGIVHYVGAVKPWHDDFPDNSLRAVYREYADAALETPWHQDFRRGAGAGGP